jgi:glucose/arabinose dehydrogenase
VRRRCFAALALVLAGCGGPETAETPTTTPQPDGSEPARELRVEVVATGLEVPWEIAFLPDGRALVTERPGRIRLLDAEQRLQAEPVGQVEVQALGEGGLMGLALDPGFEENGFVYLYFTTAEGLKLERWRFAEDDTMQRQATLVEDIEAGAIHDSGRIAFGPDEALYVATGDAGIESLPQDEGSLNGKYLRLGPEQYRGGGGERPEIVSSGHRNPQGFDWEPGSDRLVSTEHGPVGFDEVNAIVEGANYGWPEVTGSDHGDFTAPLRVYEESIAPSGAAFVAGEGSEWTGDFVFATLRGEHLRRLRLDGDEVTRDEVLLEERFGRLRTVVEGPDGDLYVLTSNRDGRGSPADEDDRILRVVPPG